MKVYKINTEKLRVEEIDIPMGDSEGCIDLKQMIKEIGCDFFDVVRIGDGDCIFVDDEGLLRQGIQPCFFLNGYDAPLVGNGLVVGSNYEGSSEEPKISIDKLNRLISFGAVLLEGDNNNNN